MTISKYLKKQAFALPVHLQKLTATPKEEVQTPLQIAKSQSTLHQTEKYHIEPLYKPSELIHFK